MHGSVYQAQRGTGLDAVQSIEFREVFCNANRGTGHGMNEPFIMLSTQTSVVDAPDAPT